MDTVPSSCGGLSDLKFDTRFLTPYTCRIQMATLMHFKQTPGATGAASELKNAENDHFMVVLTPG